MVRGADVIPPKSSWTLSKLTINQPPQDQHGQRCRGNPSKVFADPFQVDIDRPPRINMVRGAEVIIAKSLWILSKLTIN